MSICCTQCYILCGVGRGVDEFDGDSEHAEEST